MLIVSVPLTRLPELRPLLDELPDSTVVIDTSNYYPAWTGPVLALEDGQAVESQWVEEQLGRPIVKAWNAVLASTFDNKSSAPGSPRPARHPRSRRLRRRPSSTASKPVSSTRRMPTASALAAASPGRGPRRRDLAMSLIGELTTDDPTADRGSDFMVQVNRLIYN